MMNFSNPTGADQEVACTNWMLIERLSKAGGIAQVAISMVGEAQGPEPANRMLTKACRDIAKIVDLEQFQKTKENNDAE